MSSVAGDVSSKNGNALLHRLFELKEIANAHCDVVGCSMSVKLVTKAVRE